jgi:N-dimethylarginine dimethylaminohydrolase
MLFNFASADASTSDALVTSTGPRWGVDSEYGRLTDVMLSAPTHLRMVPCNVVAIENQKNGVDCCPDLATQQHQALVEALRAHGVTCHMVPPAETLPDMAFTRDATLMTPWGLLGLNPAVEHRLAEVEHVQRAAASWGVPLLGSIREGTIEGGDICLVRPGIIVIGYSGERTDAAGASTLARLFEERGWRAILYKFEPQFLHFDTQFTMVDRNRAIACADVMEAGFLYEMEALGIEIVPATYEEVQKLGANILSLGEGRLLSPADNHRVNESLELLGCEVVRVEIDQFTRCGGGMHCLTMPLARKTGLIG